MKTYSMHSLYVGIENMIFWVHLYLSGVFPKRRQNVYSYLFNTWYKSKRFTYAVRKSLSLSTVIVFFGRRNGVLTVHPDAACMLARCV